MSGEESYVDLRGAEGGLELIEAVLIERHQRSAVGAVVIAGVVRDRRMHV